MPTALPDWTALSAILVGFPTRGDTWRNNAIPAQDALLHYISLLLEHTRLRVHVVVDDASLDVARKKLGTLLDEVEVLTVPMDDCWIRDTGPVMLQDGAVSFAFNAWGGECYTDFEKDRYVGRAICKRFGRKVVLDDMILEGGSISCDGEGTLLTTKECILNTNRGERSIEQAEAIFERVLGIKKTIWLEFGAAFDTDTSGHVDNMAMFVRPGRVVLLWADREACEVQWRRSSAALKTLETSKDASGRPLQVSKVNMASAVTRNEEEAGGVVKNNDVKERRDGERVCASYVNFVVADGVVFAPAFGNQGEDSRAKMQLQQALEKRVVMVPSREFVLSGGGLHCLSLGIAR